MFGKKKKVQKNTLAQDILIAEEWVVKALNASEYKADHTLDSMKELDRFFDEQSTAEGILAKNRGQIIFSLGAYVGQTAIKLYGGQWETNDEDPRGEITIAVKLADGTTIWPVVKCMQRYDQGAEESLYAYLYALGQH